MFWKRDKNDNPAEHNQQIVLQKQLQSEDNNFHRTIIALERLEIFLNEERKVSAQLQQTAIGTDRDRHNESKNLPSKESCLMELLLQCNTLCVTAGYDDKEIFNAAVEAFLHNLLEWYAGRQLLDYYDEVDASVVPLISALTYQSNMMDVFQEYVYRIPEREKTIEEKYDEVESGIRAWIEGQDHKRKELYQFSSYKEDDGLITSHRRGDAIDGFKRIMCGMCSMFRISAPAMMVYNVVNQYLPKITAMCPHINKETIELNVSNPPLNDEEPVKYVEIKKFVKTIQYYQLYCADPVEIEQGKDGKPSFWKHLNDNCGGDIYIGDNGYFYCDKCEKEVHVTECCFNDDKTVEFGVKPNLRDFKHLAEAIAVGGMITGADGLGWFRRLITIINEVLNNK